jgi:hypothetical protein
VVWTLQALFAVSFADDLVFKGGTSLSKAYNIIQRFSKDVDLTPAFPELEFPSATQRVMRAEWTSWEKATLAHVYCLEGKLRGATGFARHWHDLVCLAEAGFAAAAIADRDLAKAVADHKAKFFPAKDAHSTPDDYHAAVGGHLRLVPAGEAFDLLKADYAAMIEAGYLEGDAEVLEALMARYGDLQDRINAAA